jgi:ParB/RepB/Spo0J family partition protein
MKGLPMLTGTFHSVLVDSIDVAPDRQRKDIPDAYIQSLADSIRRRGLIHPIVVQRDHTLVAGECRLRAHRLLGYDSIAVQYVDEVSLEELELLELEENVKRKALTWQEEVAAVARYHEMQRELNDSWSMEATAEELGIGENVVYRHLVITRNLDVPEVAEASCLSVAYNFASRREERAKTNTKRELVKDIQKVLPKTAPEVEAASLPPAPAVRAEILHTSAFDWFAAPTLLNVNFIHCDFPYGVNIGNRSGQSGAKNMGGYDDSEDVYWSLIDGMLEHQDRFLAPSAHLMFWFSMKFYQPTVDRFTAAGWRVFLPLLIWAKSDNAGILSDPHRVPRNTTETAILASRGDRKIVKAVANAYVGKTTKEFHMSEKPHAMLSHFFRMFVDESTVMLDPTAGSGMAVRVASEMGAKRALGLEMNADYAADARRNLDGRG